MTFDARIEREFRRRVAERQQTIVDSVCSGVEFEEYKYLTGYLRAVVEIFAILDETRKDIINEGKAHADSTDEDFRD